jgi:two-component system cell cycle sensor histidine kinase/response regulator CckA
MVLRMSGYTVIEAAGGAQALSSLAAGGSPITLLVTDVVMPHMNGNELARRVRQVRPEVKVLFVSGYAENAVLGEVPETCFIQKPFSPRDLLAAVRRVLDGQGR